MDRPKMADSIARLVCYKKDDDHHHPTLCASYTIRPVRLRIRGLSDALQCLMHPFTGSRLVITRVNELGRRAIIDNASTCEVHQSRSIPRSIAYLPVRPARLCLSPNSSPPMSVPSVPEYQPVNTKAPAAQVLRVEESCTRQVQEGKKAQGSGAEICQAFRVTSHNFRYRPPHKLPVIGVK